MTTLEERVAQAIAFTLAINTDLPDWMQTPALGRDTLPIGELAAPTVVAIVNDVLDNLRERLVKEREDLHTQARGYSAGSSGYLALVAEARGIRIAMRCLDEAVREAGR